MSISAGFLALLRREGNIRAHLLHALQFLFSTIRASPMKINFHDEMLRLPRSSFLYLYGHRLISSTREVIEYGYTRDQYYQLLEYRILDEKYSVAPDQHPEKPCKPSQLVLQHIKPFPEYAVLRSSYEKALAAAAIQTASKPERPVNPTKTHTDQENTYLVRGKNGRYTLYHMVEVTDEAARVDVFGNAPRPSRSADYSEPGSAVTTDAMSVEMPPPSVTMGPATSSVPIVAIPLPAPSVVMEEADQPENIVTAADALDSPVTTNQRHTIAAGGAPRRNTALAAELDRIMEEESTPLATSDTGPTEDQIEPRQTRSMRRSAEAGTSDSQQPAPVNARRSSGGSSGAAGRTRRSGDPSAPDPNPGNPEDPNDGPADAEPHNVTMFTSYTVRGLIHQPNKVSRGRRHMKNIGPVHLDETRSVQRYTAASDNGEQVEAAEANKPIRERLWTKANTTQPQMYLPNAEFMSAYLKKLAAVIRAVPRAPTQHFGNQPIPAELQAAYKRHVDANLYKPPGPIRALLDEARNSDNPGMQYARQNIEWLLPPSASAHDHFFQR